MKGSEQGQYRRACLSYDHLPWILKDTKMTTVNSVIEIILFYLCFLLFSCVRPCVRARNRASGFDLYARNFIIRWHILLLLGNYDNTGCRAKESFRYTKSSGQTLRPKVKCGPNNVCPDYNYQVKYLLERSVVRKKIMLIRHKVWSNFQVKVQSCLK